ncbi:hypothetical protein JYU29_05725 [Tianweitania sp. BSSL-BM11]|uniref:Uncharacterized protein n=1 Tax=Tianweitania aestuarii TaxID=2814886 RepID=A0ABS5RTP3_9HYPH|nr:hypothetical protein [Tianweitania aestuarii]MBS9720185.1 hypothetical protein [Tianweitania aestuarii]
MSADPHIQMIDGKPVNINDPCALAQALQGYRIKLATGGGVSEIEIQSPLTRRRMKFSSGSSVADLDKMIEEAQAACQVAIGAPPPRRKRFAISGRMRPY